MGRPKGSKNKGEKDPWKDLEEGFADRFAGADDGAIDAEIRKVALYRVAMQEAKEGDEDLKVKKGIAKEAGAIYADTEKQSKLKTKFLRQLLRSRGRELPGD